MNSVAAHVDNLEERPPSGRPPASFDAPGRRAARLGQTCGWTWFFAFVKG